MFQYSFYTMISLSESKKRQAKELRIHCDEAGRWPLAGPVTVGCSLLIGSIDMSEYKDSKQLSKKQRERLYTHINQYFPCQWEVTNCLISSTWRSSATEIDQYGIIQAINLACRRGVGKILRHYYTQILREQLLHSDFWEDILAVRLFDSLFSTWINEDTVLHFQAIQNSYAFLAWLVRDGNHRFWLDKDLQIPVVTIIKGDQKKPLISIASIVAKVERDRYMTTLTKNFPDYYFEKHKGYGSALHREIITKYGLSPIHRASFCKNISITSIATHHNWRTTTEEQWLVTDDVWTVEKPWLLLHICCAPDLSRPLHRLKEHFKLYLFRYNPNIHPRKEHEQRYSQFLKLVWLEPGDYEILEDRYDPKEFFQAMIDQKETIDPELKEATDKEVLKQAWEMQERSDRCNPCYSMRLEMAARMAAKQSIPYFTSTLLISPKKKMDKLFRRWKESEKKYPTSKFLRFDFPKNGGYEKAVELTNKHWLRRQNYCGCGRTIPKPGEKNNGYHGW